MRNFRYILLLLVSSLVWSCQTFEEGSDVTTDQNDNVEVLENGQIKFTTTLNGVSMTSLETRSTAYENNIYNGWCLVFGEEYAEYLESGEVYTDGSPLIQLAPITANENGTFTIIFDEYPNVAFMRILVNLTTRENDMLAAIYANQDNKDAPTTWRKALEDYESELEAYNLSVPPTDDQVKEYNIVTFGQYRYQSVGLDGIYNMTYETAATMTYFEEGYEDLSGAETNYGIVYSNENCTFEDGTKNDGYSTVGHGVYETYNVNAPNPANVNTSGFPMASYGFVMSAISEETIKALDEDSSQIDMIRTCSKLQVAVNDTSFTVLEIYLIGAAQESRIRSTVLSTVSEDYDGNVSVGLNFVVPTDLGGTITYDPLVEAVSSGGTSSPIYFYPNKGGDYDFTDDVVYDEEGDNPQYIVIKGQSSNYDTPGYYKVALKAQYPLDAEQTTWSALTYDILRNTSFTINLDEIDKPGYKTFEDAADVNAPANNISYSITIENSDNRYEVLVSKGTYYAELETSRVYIKGYMGEELEGCYIDFSMTPSMDGNTVPAVYIQSSDYDGDDETDCVWIEKCEVTTSDGSVDTYAAAFTDMEDGLGEVNLVQIPSYSEEVEVRVHFSAIDSGRIRMRIGDILKFIPVVYDPAPISIYGTAGQDGTGTGIVVEDDYGTSWSDFSYAKESDIEYTYEHVDTENGGVIDTEFLINFDGSVTHENIGVYDDKPELRARISPSDPGDGNAVIYLRQASDFTLTDSDGNILTDDSDLAEGEESPYKIAFTAQSRVYTADSDTYYVGDLFKLSDIDDDGDGYSVVLDLADIPSLSVDGVTIKMPEITDTTVDEYGNTVDQDDYFVQTVSDDGKLLTFTATAIDYDVYDVVLDEDGEETTGDTDSRQEFIESKVPTFVLYNNTADAKIVIENSAGDNKTYTVTLTQYPPVYLVSPTGTGGKSFNMGGGTSYACVYALNLWNYDASDSGYSWGYDVSYSSYNSSFSYWGTSYDAGDVAFGKLIVPYLFDSDYIDDDYNWSTDASSITISGATCINGTTTSENITPVEINSIGGYQGADAIVGMIRNTQYGNSSAISYYNTQATATVVFTITDKFGDTYTTTKTLVGN